MRIMFVMMNSARLSVGMQGLAVAERAYQQSLDYAQERTQGRAIGATETSPIIDFPDVRRMLMTQKAFIAALRRMMLLNAVYVDISTHHPDAATRARADEIVGLLTPICKSFGTDLGNELTSLALQIHGGMGFIEETGAAQHYRDVRIAAIYEGTNGIQAADLIGRKLPVRDGASVLEFIASMRELDSELATAGEEFASIRAQLNAQLDTLEQATAYMLRTGASDPNSALSGSTPYLRIWGLVVGGWLMAKSALAARDLERRRHRRGAAAAGPVLRRAAAAAGRRPRRRGHRGLARPVRARRRHPGRPRTQPRTRLTIDRADAAARAAASASSFHRTTSKTFFTTPFE